MTNWKWIQWTTTTTTTTTDDDYDEKEEEEYQFLKTAKTIVCGMY